MQIAKSSKFWFATEQSNLADKMEDYSSGCSAVVSVWKPNFGNVCSAVSGLYKKVKVGTSCHSNGHYDASKG